MHRIGCVIFHTVSLHVSGSYIYIIITYIFQKSIDFSVKTRYYLSEVDERVLLGIRFSHGTKQFISLFFIRSQKLSGIFFRSVINSAEIINNHSVQKYGNNMFEKKTKAA